jgi:single-strand DNA-binding protein
MEITGRLTKDAVIKKTTNDKDFVTFTVAVNDSYKAKGVEQPVKTVLYIDCAYWLSTNVAKVLKKGGIVEVSGRLYINAYSSVSGEAKASLNCHVNTIKLHSSGKGETVVQSALQTAPTTEPTEDLPF